MTEDIEAINYHARKKAIKAFHKVADDSYKAMTREFKASLDAGKNTLWWEYTPSQSLDAEYNEKVCKRLVNQALLDGYYAKYVVREAYPTPKKFVVISTTKINIENEMLSNILVLVFIFFLVILLSFVLIKNQ